MPLQGRAENGIDIFHPCASNFSDIDAAKLNGKHVISPDANFGQVEILFFSTDQEESVHLPQCRTTAGIPRARDGINRQIEAQSFTNLGLTDELVDGPNAPILERGLFVWGKSEIEMMVRH